MTRTFAIASTLLAVVLASPSLRAQSALPPAQNLDQLEEMVVGSLGAGVGQAGGPMAPIDRRMRLAACGNGIQIDPPSAGAVTVRCTTAGWRLRVPLMRNGAVSTAGASALGGSGGGSGSSIANAEVRRGDPVQLIAQGPSYSISIDAMAMEDGRIGNRIRVASAAKGSTMFAEVVDVGKVRLLGFK